MNLFNGLIVIDYEFTKGDSTMFLQLFYGWFRVGFTIFMAGECPTTAITIRLWTLDVILSIALL
jgi:hypothetical protein